MICKTCLHDLPLDSFKRRSDANCYRGSCKSCISVNKKNKHLDNPLKKKSSQRRSYLKNRDSRIAKVKEYNKTEKGKSVSGKSTKAWYQRNKIKAKAHRMFHKALKDGIVNRQVTCSMCPSTGKIEAHHDDYSKPLDVIFLCRPCHRSRHMEMNFNWDEMYEA